MIKALGKTCLPCQCSVNEILKRIFPSGSSLYCTQEEAMEAGGRKQIGGREEEREGRRKETGGREYFFMRVIHVAVYTCV